MRGIMLLSLVDDQIDETVMVTGNGTAQTNDGFVILPPSMIPCNCSFLINFKSAQVTPQRNPPGHINTGLSVISLPSHWA